MSDEPEHFAALVGCEITEWTDGMAAVEMTASRKRGNFPHRAPSRPAAGADALQ